MSSSSFRVSATGPKTDEPRPHDLLWLADPTAVESDTALPEWADEDWLRRAPLVVRREQMSSADYVPVGIRGRTRSERMAAYARRSAIVRRVTPEALVCEAVWMGSPLLQPPPPITALMTLAPFLDDVGLLWGPVGGTGFSLASGLKVLHDDSDLDLVLRAPLPLTQGEVNALHAAFSSVDCRIDAQIDTGVGGFSFAEWAGGAPRVLLRTATAPLLTADPWCSMQASGSTDAANDNR